MERNELQSLARTIWWITFCLSLYLAATTGLMGYMAAAQYGRWAQVGLALVAILLLDFYTTNWLQLSIRGIFHGDTRKALGVWIWIGLSIAAFARFAGTTTVTYWSSAPIAAQIVGDLDTDKETGAIKDATDDKAGLVASLEKEKDALRNSESARISDAEKKGNDIINKAISSAGENVERLYREGNGWVMKDRKFKEYRERIREAKKEAAALVAAEKDRTQAAASAYLTAAAGGNVTVETIAGILKKKANRHATLENTYALSLRLFDLVAGGLVLLLSAFLAGFKIKHDIEYVSPFAIAFGKVGEKASADSLSEVEAAGAAVWGLFFLPFQTLRKIVSFFLALGKAGIYAIETRFRIDIDGDNVIGKPSDKSATKSDNTVQMSQNNRTVIMPFALNKKSDNFSDTGATNLATSAQDVSFVSPNVATSKNVSFVSPLQTATNDTQKSDNAGAETERQNSDKKRQAALPRRKKTATTKNPVKAYIDANRLAIKRALKAGDKVRAQALVDKLTREGYHVDNEPGKGLTIRRKGPKK